MGRCKPSTGIKAFEALVEQVMTQQPYASAKRVFWILDSGLSHRGQASVQRMAERWPTCVLVHTPVHPSRLNQVEVVFSIVQRKVVSPNDFHDLGQIETRLSAFETRYNATAGPFDWKFTAADLNDLLARLDAHERSATARAARPPTDFRPRPLSVGAALLTVQGERLAVRRMCRFQPPSESERQLLGPVAMRAIMACGLRPGKVDWLVQPAPGRNACAPGRRSVAVTDGALRSFVSGRLPADQLMAVLVHEIGHHETRAGPLRPHHDVAGGRRPDSVPPGAAGVAGAVLELLGGWRSCS